MTTRTIEIQITGDARSCVPLTIRTKSRIVSWLWRHTPIGYTMARRLAKWLP